jgi:hypothetical protein
MNAIVLIALKRPYTFVVLAILILIFGGRAAMRTPTDIFPNIGIPVVAVVWTYNGLTPEDMSGRVVYYYERARHRQNLLSAWNRHRRSPSASRLGLANRPEANAGGHYAAACADLQRFVGGGT